MFIAALATLLLAQLASAAHQFDHLATDIADTCVECLQLDRNDDAVLPATAGADLPVVHPLQRAVRPAPIPPYRAPVVRSRGPPLA